MGTAVLEPPVVEVPPAPPVPVPPSPVPAVPVAVPAAGAGAAGAAGAAAEGAAASGTAGAAGGAAAVGSSLILPIVVVGAAAIGGTWAICDSIESMAQSEYETQVALTQLARLHNLQVLEQAATRLQPHRAPSSDDDDDDPANYVYRVIRPDEDPTIGIAAKNPSASETIARHVRYGSKRWFRSQYISTTRSLDVAINWWAKKPGNRIVRIDVRKVYNRVVDLSTEIGRRLYLENQIQRNFAKAFQEVIVEFYIPPAAIEPLVGPSP